MAIKTLELSNLSTFERVRFDLVPGINVLLGANSCGKTHVLKWLYASVKAFELPVASGDDPIARVKQKLAGVFLPDDRRVGRLPRRIQGIVRGGLKVAADEGLIEFTVNSRDALKIQRLEWASSAPTVFLPSREVLALYEGFVAAYTNRELSLDETYFDACVALNASGLRGRRGELAQSLMGSIEGVLGGTVELIGERFYVRFRAETNPLLEAHLVAEGLRKIASLARLVQNGSLLRQGLLVWDEPEASLNPRLITAIVKILGELAAEGVQVVLATHDYLLAKRLSMLSEIRGAAPARFFLLSRPTLNAAVEVASGATLAELPQTPMEEEFLRLYDDERRAFMDGTRS